MAGNSPGAVRQARPAAISEMSATVAVYRYIMLVSMDAASAAEPLTDIVKCGTPHIRHWELGLVLPGQMRA